MVSRNLSLARQVAQEILTGIDEKTLPRDNGMLPSEAALTQRYRVSRATIREALSQLEQRGVVLRRHGVGTFVAHQTLLEAGLEELASLETLARRSGLETKMTDLQIAERGATAAESAALASAPAAKILSVSRIILADKRPIAYLIDIVPTTLLQRQDLDRAFRGSVLDLFTRRRDLHLSHSRTDILIELADAAIARKLKIKRGEPLHKLSAQLFTRDGRIVDYSSSYFVPGYFHFHVIRKIGS